MNELVLATSNPSKFDLYSGYLVKFRDLNLLSLQDFPSVASPHEPYESAVENARHKAECYSRDLGCDVLAVDMALYLDFLPKDKQPGVYVRRIIDKETESSDIEIFNYIQKLVKNVPDTEATGYWRAAFCIKGTKGTIYQDYQDDKFAITKNANPPTMNGFPLSTMTRREHLGKVYADMSEYERDLHRNIAMKKLGNLVKKYIMNK